MTKPLHGRTHRCRGVRERDQQQPHERTPHRIRAEPDACGEPVENCAALAGMRPRGERGDAEQDGGERGEQRELVARDAELPDGEVEERGREGGVDGPVDIRWRGILSTASLGHGS